MKMLPNDIKLAIANTNISKYRKILVKAINAHGLSLPTEYDKGFHYGMEHALYLLDQMCRELFEKAIKSEKAKKVEMRKVDIYEEIKELKAENAELKAQVEELTDKHWEECRQIALYDDQIKSFYVGVQGRKCSPCFFGGFEKCNNFKCSVHDILGMIDFDRWYNEVKQNPNYSAYRDAIDEAWEQGKSIDYYAGDAEEVAER